MNPAKAIYTEKNNCQDCYKCIRHCPVKAIKIEGHSASIVDDLCIYCGKCTTICPAGAKKVRNDISAVKFLMGKRKNLILSLAPSWVNEFEGYDKSQLLAAIKALGFSGISETALGATLVSHNVVQWWNSRHRGPAISSCCPVIVELIRKYYPWLSAYITPFPSPMETHGAFLHQQYGENTAVVFAGPCIAKKTELELPGNTIDAALTFTELKQWFDDEGFLPDFFTPKNTTINFVPYQAGNSALYPVDGGMINSIRSNVSVTDSLFMSFSGIKQVRAILDDFDSLCNDNIFLELMACEGGCINGPATNTKNSPVKKRMNVLTVSYNNAENQSGKCPTASYAVSPVPFQSVKVFSEQEILGALNTVGKTSAADELNCGGCGYDSCREFAKAMLDGKAERQMCVSYMRRVAQNKATVLLQKIPYGVVMMDEKGKIIESNSAFADLLGDEARELFSNRPRLEGAALGKLVPFARYFDTVIKTGADSIDKDITFNNRQLQLSVFTIQKHKIVCGIIHDMSRSLSQMDAVVSRLRKVMLDNMATAQKAAFLLGENVSQTETMLNSVIALFDSDSDEQ